MHIQLIWIIHFCLISMKVKEKIKWQQQLAWIFWNTADGKQHRMKHGWLLKEKQPETLSIIPALLILISSSLNERSPHKGFFFASIKKPKSRIKNNYWGDFQARDNKHSTAQHSEKMHVQCIYFTAHVSVVSNLECALAEFCVDVHCADMCLCPFWGEINHITVPRKLL